jgi:hypothetical protein
MSTAWYGTKMPNRMSGKMMFAPGSRVRASTKPLAEPSSAEMIAAGMVTTRLLPKPDCSLGHTASKLSSENELGSCHMPLTVASAGFLNAVHHEHVHRNEEQQGQEDEHDVPAGRQPLPLPLVRRAVDRAQQRIREAHVRFLRRACRM